MRALIRGLSRNRGGIALLGGVAAVLTGVEAMLAPTPKRQVRSAMPQIRPVPAMPKPRADYFAIRQTRSELGYVYWVLQGYGRYQSFALFDTWAEASAEAQSRLRAAQTELWEPELQLT